MESYWLFTIFIQLILMNCLLYCGFDGIIKAIKDKP